MAVTINTENSEAAKNIWVEKDLKKKKKKRPKKECFEENQAIWNAKKNKTTKTWVEEDLSNFPKTRRH